MLNIFRLNSLKSKNYVLVEELSVYVYVFAKSVSNWLVVTKVGKAL